MKISKQTKNDLLTLIEHTRADISAEGEGFYSDIDNDGERVMDKKAIKEAQRAIEFIKQLIILN